MVNAPATELTQAEKAAAWDRYISLKQAHDANEREIEDRYNKRYELQRLIDNNYKATMAQAGQPVEPCPGCGFEICNCEKVSF
jgi:hypothetical protein